MRSRVLSPIILSAFALITSAAVGCGSDATRAPQEDVPNDGDAAIGDDLGGADAEGEDAASGDVDGDAVEGPVLIIASEGGEVLLPDGLGRLVIPPGALAEDTTLTVELGVNTARGGVGPSLIFGPSGTTFDPPATLELTVDKSGWDTSLEAYGLAPALVIDQGDTLESVLRVDEVDGPETFMIRHFSTFQYEPGPVWGWQPNLAFPRACYELWSTPAIGGTPPAASNKPFIGSCPHYREWNLSRRRLQWPPAPGDIIPRRSGALEWVDVTGGTMTTVNTDATSGTLHPSGQITVRWDLHFALWTSRRSNVSDWCRGDLLVQEITSVLAGREGEAARRFYTSPTATCAPLPEPTPRYPGAPRYDWACSCQVSFAPFSWPDEPIPYTISGSTLDLFGESFGFSVDPEANSWWMDVPLLATNPVFSYFIGDVPEFRFYKMKLITSK